MEGWIKLYRKIQENWLWNEKRKFSKFEAWIDILFRANHKDEKTMINGRLVDMKKGSFITPEVKLAGKWNWDRKTVRRFLTILENEKMITKKATAKYTNISIENWEVYQNKEQQNEQPKEQQEGQARDNQWDSRRDTDKNEKNIKNIKNNSSSVVDDSCVDGLQEIINFYNNNIGMLTSYGLEVLSDYAKEMPSDLIIFAMKIAVEANKRTIQYIKGILNNWNKKGIKTLIDAEQENQKYNKNTKQTSKNTDWGSIYDDLIKREGGQS